MKRRAARLALLFLAGASLASAQTRRPDSSFLAEIAKVKAIDVHAHPEPAGAGLEGHKSLEDHLLGLESPDPAMCGLTP